MIKKDSYYAQVQLGEKSLVYTEVYPWSIKASLWGPKVRGLVIELYNPRNERVNCEVWKIQWFKVSALVPIKDLDREIVVTETAEEIENRLNKRLADLLSDSPT